MVGATGGLCGACWSKLSFIAAALLGERLGTPFGYDPGPWRSVDRGGDQPAATLARARAAVRYDDIASALVHSLKYGHRRLILAPTMGRWMAQAGRELTSGADALVPVPRHWRRLWARRFNQAATHARAVAQASGVLFDDAAKRRRATPQQVGLNRADRATNVQGASSRCRRALRPRSRPAG